MTVYVCMSVRDHIFKVHADLRPFYVTYGRGLVLLWRRSDMICTSGFTDDVMFAHNVLAYIDTKKTCA